VLAGISSLMAVVVVFFGLLLCLLCECGDAGVSDSMLLITNEQLYTPLPRGREGGSVVSMLPEDYPVETITGVPVRVVDAGGGFVVPGLIDMHVHVAGGSGEMGPVSRNPEATIGVLVDAEIATVVGIVGVVLGTDCIFRRYGISGAFYDE
jgi:beta-aspartyl-dipeptidase (metallo-type)